jgi:hypothetical protein
MTQALHSPNSSNSLRTFACIHVQTCPQVVGSVFYLDFDKMIPLRASPKYENLKNDECAQMGEFGIEATMCGSPRKSDKRQSLADWSRWPRL